MALNRFETRTELLSALGMIGREPTLDATAIAQRLYARRDMLTQGTESFFSYLNIARSARNITDAAQRLRDDPLTRLTAATIPVDPSMDRRMMRYQYRVRVDIRNPDGSVRSTNVEVIRSPDRLTDHEAREAARHQFVNRGQFPDDESPKGRPAQGGETMIAVLISAGQRP